MVGISVTTKLAAVKPIATRMAIGMDLQTGKAYAQEYGAQVRGQMSFSAAPGKPSELMIDGKSGGYIHRRDRGNRECSGFQSRKTGVREDNMDMTKDALQYVVGLKKAEIIEVNGDNYSPKRDLPDRQSDPGGAS